MKDKSKPKGFTLYTDMKPLVDYLENDPMLKAMFNYICEGTEPVFESEKYELVWQVVKVKLDASLEYHKQAIKTGRKGGLTRAENQRKRKENQGSLREPKEALGSLRGFKGLQPTRQDRTRQDCINNQPCSFPEGELTADMMEEYEKLNAELEEDEDE